MKKFVFLLTFLIVLLIPKQVFAQNKMGVNIGDHWADFEKAAQLVGSGGWVVVMACPGDGDEIAKIAAAHPEINLVIRGHYPGQTPNEENNKLAKLWAATLASISFQSKVYFMPWNEPNQPQEGGGAPIEIVISYTQALKSELQSAGILDSKVILLSPMLDKLNASFPGYFTNSGGKSSFYGMFGGSSINEYDQFSPGPCSATALNNNCKYDEIGIPGPYFAPEAGVAGTCSPPCYKDNELRQMLDASWQKWGSDANFKMFAIFSYDPHRTEEWDIFSSSQTANFYSTHRQSGCCTQGASSGTKNTGLKLCTNKKHSFFIDDESECGECGGDSSLLSCLPIEGKDETSEQSKNTVSLKENAAYTKECIDCESRILEAKFGGNLDLSSFSIPFVEQLTKYFLGPNVDNPKRNLNPDIDPLQKAGVLQKMLSGQQQDDLRKKFLQEILFRIENKRNTAYKTYRINGLKPRDVLNKYNGIQDKLKSGPKITAEEEKFLNTIWPQVPLFANEESEGRVQVEGSGIFPENSKEAKKSKNVVKTSVPLVYRYNQAVNLLAQIIVPNYQPQNSGVLSSSSENSQVLPASTECVGDSCPLGGCPIQTEEILKKENLKKAITGKGKTICVIEQGSLSGSRAFFNNAGEMSCSTNAGGCDGDPLSVKDKCCGNKGKCVVSGSGNSLTAQCQENSCNSCWYGDQGQTFSGCCVPSSSATKEFNVELSSVNYTPYTKTAVNATDKVFKLFVPAEPPAKTASYFQEVAGISQQQPVLSGNAQTKEYKCGTENFQTNLSADKPVGLLFNNLGTMIRSAYLVAGRILNPLYKGGDQDSSGDINLGGVLGDLRELITQVANNAGVPLRILEAILRAEGGAIFGYTSDQIKEYSQSGGEVPNCKPNHCSAKGPMQFTTGVDDKGSNSCSGCGLSQCPNTWSAYAQAGENVCNLKDSLTVAARYIKALAGAGATGSWSRETVDSVVNQYGGSNDNCQTKYAHIGNRTYCDFVWWYYNQ